MRAVCLDYPADFAGWRREARRLIAQNILPEQVSWSVREAQGSLFESQGGAPAGSAKQEGGAKWVTVPRAFMEVARLAALHREHDRFGLLYGLLWRIQQGERQVARQYTDPAMHRALKLATQVRRDVRALRVFARFRRCPQAKDAPRYVAWFEPEHHVVEACAPYFARRFGAVAWSIVTPLRSAHWDGERLLLGPGGEHGSVPDHDPAEELWRTFYANTTDPERARLRGPKSMQGNMPKKYWPNLPEARLLEPSGPSERQKPLVTGISPLKET